MSVSNRSFSSSFHSFADSPVLLLDYWPVSSSCWKISRDILTRINYVSHCRFPIDIWIEICHNLSVKSLFTLRTVRRILCFAILLVILNRIHTYNWLSQASKDLSQTVDTRSVWLCAFNDLLRVKPSVYTPEDIEEMSISQLREASRWIVQIDWVFSVREAPYHETTVLNSVPVSDCYDVTLLPGGKRALIPNSDGALHVYDIAADSLLFSAPKIEDDPVNRCGVRHLYPMSLHTGYVVVFVAMQ